MFHVVLWEPSIPPNTGNVARLCAATGVPLHLVGRLGFRLDDRSLRRAGVDYWREVQIIRHASLEDFEQTRKGARLFLFTAQASQIYTQASYNQGDYLLFGNEGHGLPREYIARYSQQAWKIPMPSGKVRSLNLATAVGIVLYEALRQVSPDFTS